MLSLFLAFVFSTAHATYFEGCGDYIVRGQIVINGDKAELIVFQESLSETVLEVHGKKIKELRAYDESEVEVSGRIKKSLVGYRGKLHLKNIEYTTPNFLAPNNGQGFWVTKRRKCD